MRVVAEWGQTNRGSVEIACRQAQATKTAGAWGAKWQLLRPETLTAGYAPAYWTHAAPGERQFDTFCRNGIIDYGAWREVREECDRLGVAFLATPFDLDAVEALDQLDPDAIKVASGDITYHDLLRAVAATGRDVFLSTGASHPHEIAAALGILGFARTTLLACDLVYPCPEDQANLARIPVLAEWAGDGAVGYSDHTLSPTTALAAAAVGATLLEKHCTLDPDGPVPDDRMGLTPDLLAAYVDWAEDGERLRGIGTIVPSEAEGAARVGARRAWHAIRDLPGGYEIRDGDVAALRPCPAGCVGVDQQVDGYRLKQDVKAGEPLTLVALGWG